MVASFFRLPFRPSPFRREAFHSLRSNPRVHRAPTARPSDTDTELIDVPMLQKGDGRYAPQEAIVSGTLHAQGRANTRLGKMLFPSSSPNGPQSSQDGNIKDAFQRGVSSKPGSHSASAPQTTTRGLDAPKSITPLRPASGNSHPNAGPRFQSVCTAASDPFADEVHGKAWDRFPSIDEDLAWLEENDDDLDFLDSAPAPVPAVAQKPSPPLPSPAPAKKLNTIGSSQSAQIPWSSSPPHHMYPPPVTRVDSGASNTSNHSLKRKSQEDIKPESAPKRRGLPFATKTEAQEPEVITIDDEDEGVKATPAPKPGRYDPLEATASAIKEQRKSHKLQRTQSGGPEPENPPSKTEDLSLVSVKAVEPIFLSTEQKQVLELVTKKGQSVFFTGPAGTGKSVLMRSIITDLKKKWAKYPERLAVTASTGLAACNIGGITLHSFSGIGLGKEDVPSLVKKIRRNPKAKERWLKTKCLVIDEISMVDGALFDKLEQIGRILRKNSRPWGGIQLVVTGDFFQLPPVPDSDTRSAQFAFEASTWTTSIAHTIGLTQIFRQRDPQFADMLNEMRLGRVSDGTVSAFKQLARPLRFADGVEATELFPTRMEVERSNQRRLNALPGKPYRFDSADTGDPKIRDRLLQNMMAPKMMDLKVGAQVMLIKNLDEQLCNGTIGKIKQFSTETEWNSEMGGGGTTEDEPVDLERAVKKLKKFAHNGEPSSRAGTVPYPVVEFICTDGSHRTLLCIPHEWTIELPNGELQAKRSQVPLILAWALSIHKAQGQTLERVKVDLTRTFEKGQAYVALSRATTQQGLQVLKFDKGKVMAHPRVVQFYNQLYSADQAVKGTATGSKGKQTTLQGMFKGEGFGGHEQDVETLGDDVGFMHDFDDDGLQDHM